MATPSASRNVGGATVFDEAYAGNCLVNAMCVGILDPARLSRRRRRGRATSSSSTARPRDATGIGGASVLASQELGEDDAEQASLGAGRRSVHRQKLIEVSVELVESGLVESLQDCGAAGLASALSEMARDGTASTSRSTASRSARREWSPGRS